MSTKKCACGQTAEFNRYCGAHVCNCGNHIGMCMCF